MSCLPQGQKQAEITMIINRRGRYLVSKGEGRGRIKITKDHEGNKSKDTNLVLTSPLFYYSGGGWLGGWHFLVSSLFLQASRHFGLGFGDIPSVCMHVYGNMNEMELINWSRVYYVHFLCTVGWLVIHALLERGPTAAHWKRT
jgi:hypothetical protein